ncbi:MAG TPA: hypothetical protein PLZ84_08040 [Clostridia bacterium]|nr:hypothetical protein [Clostridia bacterium]
MPHIPDYCPRVDISFEDTVKLLLASIALEEFSIAHIMNAEAEKIQEIVKSGGCDKLHQLICIDKTVDTVLRDLIKKEMLLEFKFENVLDLMDKTKK